MTKKRPVRLDDLTPDQRRIVLALIEADKAAKEEKRGLLPVKKKS